MQKPLSLLRRDYINKLCDITNKSCLPAFVVVEALEKLLNQMRKAVDIEIKRDETMWNKSCVDSEDVTENGQIK